jgi:hypothetical protein
MEAKSKLSQHFFFALVWELSDSPSYACMHACSPFYRLPAALGPNNYQDTFGKNSFYLR